MELGAPLLRSGECIPSGGTCLFASAQPATYLALPMLLAFPATTKLKALAAAPQNAVFRKQNQSSEINTWGTPQSIVGTLADHIRLAESVAAVGDGEFPIGHNAGLDPVALAIRRVFQIGNHVLRGVVMRIGVQQR